MKKCFYGRHNELATSSSSSSNARKQKALLIYQNGEKNVDTTTIGYYLLIDASDNTDVKRTTEQTPIFTLHSDFAFLIQTCCPQSTSECSHNAKRSQMDWEQCNEFVYEMRM